MVSFFRGLQVKTCVITQDASVELSKERTTIGKDLIEVASDQLQALTDVLSEEYKFPHVW